ncbi:MAG: XdhC family protein [Candidatus Latescibacteria bacterium]|nr:XdhC family protein [Candidatus Latescibacterota bacterium]
MKDLQTIVERARQLDQTHTPYVLATVVQTSGSVYRGPGTRMLVEEDLQSHGSINGGCLEGDVRETPSKSSPTAALSYCTTMPPPKTISSGAPASAAAAPSTSCSNACRKTTISTTRMFCTTAPSPGNAAYSLRSLP